MLTKKLHIQEEEIKRKNSIRLNLFKLNMIYRSLIVIYSKFTINYILIQGDYIFTITNVQ
jgi:hypothetical protein